MCTVLCRAVCKSEGCLLGPFVRETAVYGICNVVHSAQSTMRKLPCVRAQRKCAQPLERGVCAWKKETLN